MIMKYLKTFNEKLLINDDSKIILSEEETINFKKIVEGSDEPNDALKKAFKEYNELSNEL